MGDTSMKRIDTLGSSVAAKSLAETAAAPQEYITAEEKEIKELDQKVEDNLPKTGLSAWEQQLKDANISKQEAAKVLDSILTRGIYEEVYKYGPTVFKFRTRTATDADRVIEMLQEFEPRTSVALQHLITRINVASSLSSYGDRVFSFSLNTDNNRALLDTEFNERYLFISNIPQPVFFAMTQVLEKFDKKVSLCCDPRSLENF